MSPDLSADVLVEFAATPWALSLAAAPLPLPRSPPRSPASPPRAFCTPPRQRRAGSSEEPADWSHDFYKTGRSWATSQKKQMSL